jgi:hypothetical protein
MMEAVCFSGSSDSVRTARRHNPEDSTFQVRVKFNFLASRLPLFSFCDTLICFLNTWLHFSTRLCGLVVRVPGYRSRGAGFDFRRYQVFWEVMGLEQGSLSLMSTIVELLGRNSSSSGLENREYGRGDPLRWPCDTLYQQKLVLTSPTSGGHSVGTVLLWTKATEFVLFLLRFSLCLVKKRAFWLHLMMRHDILKS